MLYFSPIYSRIQYGIITRGNAAKKYIQKLTVCLSNLIRTITFSSKYCRMTVLFKKLKLLRFGDVYKLQLAKFMYQLYHNLSLYLNKSFVKITAVHTRKTRQAQNVVYFVSRVKKNLGLKLISNKVCKLWEEIDKSTKDQNWHSIKKRYKEMLLKAMTNYGSKYFEECKFHISTKKIFFSFIFFLQLGLS